VSERSAVRVRLQHTHIFASDIGATLAFWQEMFSAQVLFDTQIAGARNVMIAVGSGKINIYDQPPREGGSGAYHHLGLQTDDLDALVEQMRDKGFRFQGQIREHGHLRYIMAMAPDNILLEIFQVLSDETSPKRLQGLRKAFDWGAGDT
jgi:catechol 2,3-dioxygenase-like lactoylglutathione lyase family enzyme